MEWIKEGEKAEMKKESYVVPTVVELSVQVTDLMLVSDDDPQAGIPVPLDE